MRGKFILNKWFTMSIMIIFMGCAGEALKTAQKKNTIEAYNQFLKEYGDSEFAPKARLRIEEISWEGANKKDTIPEYEQFLLKYPNSKFASKSKLRIEEIPWEGASQKDTIPEYEQFLLKYPNSKFASKAKLRIEEIPWEGANKKDTIPKYEQFLSKYPNSKFASKAKLRIEEMSWEGASKKDTISEYGQFLSKYPNSKFASKAKLRIEEISWERASSIDIFAQEKVFSEERLLIPETSSLVHSDPSATVTGKIMIKPNRTDCRQLSFSIEIVYDGKELSSTHSEQFYPGVAHVFIGHSCMPDNGERYNAIYNLSTNPTAGGSMGLRGGMIVFSGPVSITGTVSMAIADKASVFDIESDPLNPLIFVLTNNGYKYVSGKGTVIVPNGKHYDFPHTTKSSTE